ncbi:hypothetical protein COX21_00670 [Candidatus Falkowbacteria bacterium CG23_combo_of_CG06-09_8_20_14_all_41_10]|uniref:Uncharacterized protein n=1 Tax=Candidatus Falkowbacteria bacterium CG23_combo_of_CG06-09_8_20_14_all_41_10 TaxID=1974571 RepID=A0A2G9ZNY9_9BACT|nr:MAG: hypothetical protein COX21_00670 [Candidatus Falkowbacteria bacterium CG23_combo_of_CG06-09_8_20_14_all_41_10]
MITLLNNPKFASFLINAKSEHEKFTLVGEIIIAEYPKPLVSFPGVPREVIIKALVAACTTEEEIRRVLIRSGLGIANVIVVEKPKNEKEKRAMILCRMMSGILNKEGLPCVLIFRP